MTTYGIKVSKPGNDVKTCTDDKLVMSSKFDMLKTKMVGTTNGSVAHGLSYIPVYVSMSKISSTKWGIVGQNYHTGIPYCDGTNFESGSDGTDYCKYYIFYQASV